MVYTGLRGLEDASNEGIEGEKRGSLQGLLLGFGVRV